MGGADAGVAAKANLPKGQRGLCSSLAFLTQKKPGSGISVRRAWYALSQPVKGGGCLSVQIRLVFAAFTLGWRVHIDFHAAVNFFQCRCSPGHILPPMADYLAVSLVTDPILANDPLVVGLRVVPAPIVSRGAVCFSRVIEGSFCHDGDEMCAVGS